MNHPQTSSLPYNDKLKLVGQLSAAFLKSVVYAIISLATALSEPTKDARRINQVAAGSPR
jgi:hypothetical protein